MIRYDEFGDAIVAKLSGACFFTPIVAPRFLKQPGDLAAADKAEADDLPLIMDYRERIAAAANGVRIAGRITLADRAVTSPFANLAHSGVAIDRARAGCGPGAHPGPTSETATSDACAHRILNSRLTT